MVGAGREDCLAAMAAFAQVGRPACKTPDSDVLDAATCWSNSVLTRNASA